MSSKTQFGQFSGSCTFLVQFPCEATAVKLLGLLPKGWLRGVDLNHRPLGYEPNELPDCSTPHSDLTRPSRRSQGKRALAARSPCPVREVGFRAVLGVKLAR